MPSLDISASSSPDITASTLIAPSFSSSCGNDFSFSTNHPAKRLRESESFPPGLSASVSDPSPAFTQYQNDSSEKISQSFGFSCAYNHNLNANHPSFSCLPRGSHALSNGNSSSSEPISWAMKQELPSLQYSDTQMGSWGSPSSPLPYLESVDTFIQSPPTEQTQPDGLSPWNNGLLEAVLYGSQTLKNTKKTSCQQTPSASVMPGDMVDSPSQSGTEWEVCGDSISPLGPSPASTFNDCISINGRSQDGPHPVHSVSGRSVLFPYSIDRLS